MRARVSVVLMAAVLIMVSSFCSNAQEAAQQDSAAIEKAVLETYDRITQTAEKVDPDALFSFVLENDKGCLISDGRLIMTRSEALENHRNNSGGLASIDYIMDKKFVTVLSPDTALMAVEGRYEAATHDGRTFGSPVAQTVVFVRKDGQWKVLHSHTSRPTENR